MLLTAVHPDRARGAGLHATDVEVDDGLPLPALLAHLVRLTGWAGWPTAPVAVGATTLTPAHLTGQFPLVAGCTLLPAARPGDDVGGRAAVELRAPWHVAVVSGPDCGAVLGIDIGPGPGRRGTERRVVAVRDVPTDSAHPGADLMLRDPSWAGLTLRVRAYRRRGRARFAVRLTGADASTRTARLVRPGSGRSTRLRAPSHRATIARVVAAAGLGRPEVPVGGRSGRAHRRPSERRWRPGQVLHVGATTLELRRSPTAHVALPDGRERAGAVEPEPYEGRRRRPSRAEVLTWTAPAAGSVALAVALGQPALLLAAAVGPVVAFASRTGQERAGSEPTGQDRAGLDHTGLGRSAAAGADGSAAWGPDPAALVARTVHALWGGTGAGAVDEAGPVDAPAARRAGAGPAGGGSGTAAGRLCAAGATLAVVGPADVARAVARAVLLQEVGTGGALAVAVHTGAGGAWSWTRWLPSGRRLPTGTDPETLVVADLTGTTSAAAFDATVGELAAWRVRVPSRHRLLLVLPSAAPAVRAERPPAAAPAWCRTTLEVDVGGAVLRTPDGRRTASALHAVTIPLAEQQARRVAALSHVGARPEAGSGDAAQRRPGAAVTGGEPPAVADLGALPGVPGANPDEVRGAWARGGAGLPVQLGIGPGGAPVEVDLVRDGPHLLVAGTTGAGKSQLLAALVLGLALRQPPERLAVAVVDFKGGTSLGAVADLPHVVGRVDDLDAAHTSRALTGLRAELHRRERLVAAAGVRDVADLDPADPATPARLLVVVDEFRALADELPDALPALARLAAQGRSLGMHLVLATQRPAGSVTPDLRANIALRACLRVTDAAESQDVLDSSVAAAISPDRPGRAWLRRGSGPLEAVQVARTRTGDRSPAVRPAPPWCDPTGILVGSSATVSSRQRSAGPLAPSVDDLDARAWVHAVQRAAAGRALPASPWLPELPARVEVADARRAGRAVSAPTAPAAPAADTAARTLTLGLADRPEEQRRAHLGWRPEQGHLLVLGGPRSGRTTTLVGLGVQGAAAGWTVHGIGLPDDASDVLARTGGLGTRVGTDDPRRCARLLELLTVRRDGTRHLLLVDGVEAVLAALAPVARGAAADRLTGLWSEGPRGVSVVASAAVAPATAGLAASFRDRLVLPVTDPGLDLVAGVPPELRGARRVPGRAVHLGPSGAVLCQVTAVPAAGLTGPGRPGAPTAPTAPTAPVPPAGAAHGRRSPRLAALPARATLPGERTVSAALASSAGTQESGAAARVALGLGGDDATEVSVDLSRGLLVTGPPGSGRSTALATVVVQLRRQGHRVVRLGPAGAALDAVSTPGTIAEVSAPPGTGPRAGSGAPPSPSAARPVVVVDDLDELEVTDPTSADLLAEAVVRGELCLLASVLTDRAASAFRGPVAHAVRTAVLLVLEPTAAGSADLLGPRAPWVTDPSGPVGRGAVRQGRQVEPVQVYLPG